ncbi:ParB/RepB/Spo0J family partition protein [Labrys sp. KNU-23]|uniref:ParB/RepB/Spo0J family partition protein n=1 Tax=Labrys sp. KNU-23 TaxID=2789216 RepID=UPI0011ECD9F6|nr:ParB/RepB/Spo0J family partition protein [Labrys sp. KNU-23]QEN84809.1 ParB/RepB/Spo0J family partition protein [Labrys sp. KNU-23]
MANAVRKITLSSSRDIPFNKLVLSQANVRRVKAGISIEELADSIVRRGLIQSLHVRPILDAEGVETGMFEVPAGGRRFRALELLIKQKRLAKAAPVPCVVSDADSGILIDEVSLAENIERAPLHPLDQFRAFLALRDKGMSEEAIAAAFFVPVQVVKQRLRLASVSPTLLEVYAEDGMTLEMLMAFTVCEDHERQEQVWDAIRNSWQKDPYHIRRLLTETTVRACDKRAVFVGIEQYEAAGGIVLRDLFQSDDGGWLQDVGLLDRLVMEKLKATADEIAGEGWKWVGVAVSQPYGSTHGLRELVGTIVDPTEEDQAARDTLQAEYNRLSDEYDGVEELPDSVDRRFGELEAAMEALDNRPVSFEPAEIAIAGAFVSIYADGSLLVDRGYVRPEDEVPVAGGEGNANEVDGDADDPAMPVLQRAVITIGGQPAQIEEEDEDGIKPLSERLLVELTAHRTLAIRDAVAQHPQVAMTMLLHKLVCDTFQHRSATGCLEAHVRHVFFPAQADDLSDSPSAKAVAERHQAWMQETPDDDEALWGWLAGLDEASRMALLAHCISYGVNALQEKPNPYGGSGVSEHGLKLRLAQADRLARATTLDMAEAGWRPTSGNYLGRVTKARILQAVAEGKGQPAADRIAHLKKGEMASEAETLLAGTGWLPEPLRLPVIDAGGEEAAAKDGITAMGIDDAIDDSDEAIDAPHTIAAA